MSKFNECEIVENDYSKAPRKLSEVVKIGDYVDYPADYINIRGLYDYATVKVGWRVLGCEENIVKLVSAGIPLRYWHDDDPYKSARLLRENFCDIAYIPYDDTWYRARYSYRSCGFFTFISSGWLGKVFPSEYTLFVRSLTKEDIEDVKMLRYGNCNYIAISDLFFLGVAYWLASVDGGPYLWHVDASGVVSGKHGFTSGVRPVVYLKSTIQTTGKNANGAWKICMPKLK